MTYAPVVTHCEELLDALGPFRRSAPLAGHWGERLAAVLCGGGRLLAAGNGGSAAQAQHLTAELVGRYRTDRPPFSAIALHADTSSTTAIANDYGVDELFARQVRAHGRPGDVLILLSTSGASANLLSAAAAGRAAGLHVWALTGPAPNPLAAAADEAFCVAAPSAATVQELHLVAVHMVCEAFDEALEADGLPHTAPATTHGTGVARSLSSRLRTTDGSAPPGAGLRDGTRRLDGKRPPGAEDAPDGAAGRRGQPAGRDGGPADGHPRTATGGAARRAAAPGGGTGRHRAAAEDGTGRKERRDG
ncbi:D-sedoheptulose 7-phosphate isomerase [Streptomyces griseoaurantiacus]|uniref:D-sedoheptulose 7-phosphate isomerase n=1 Tax=Streptomyces griseoaurantiacus TaxID=68213 RepID=A0A1G7XPI1_9ACTN|nr:D-sedoheptulose 7-phosphate isomerase [Streptomyces jietaisiensis]